jgi:hypothetical protein
MLHHYLPLPGTNQEKLARLQISRWTPRLKAAEVTLPLGLDGIGSLPWERRLQ